MHRPAAPLQRRCEMRHSNTLNPELVATGSAAAARSFAPPDALQRLASLADVAFNGARPWDIWVHDPTLYGRVLRGGSRGLGEAYMDGLWDSNQLDETLTRLVRAGAKHRLRGIAGRRLDARLGAKPSEPAPGFSDRQAPL
jgi:hypothetical protein